MQHLKRLTLHIMFGGRLFVRNLLRKDNSQYLLPDDIITLLSIFKWMNFRETKIILCLYNGL